METDKEKDSNLFSKQIGEKEKRKLKALHEKKQSIWFGLGMVGMVGWSVAVPALFGAAFGIWLDKTYPQTFSWTISFLMLGILSGCMIAWHWIAKEDKEMHQDNE